MVSASSTVLMRCATTNVVRSDLVSLSAFWSFVSVSTSTALVLSSRMRIFGSTRSARAIAMRCFCPPERFAPRCSMRLS